MNLKVETAGGNSSPASAAVENLAGAREFQPQDTAASNDNDSSKIKSPGSQNGLIAKAN